MTRPRVSVTIDRPSFPAPSIPETREAALVELTVTSDPVRLSFLQALLADAGIESFVFDGEGPWPGAIPSRLMVAADDEAAARALMSSA